MRAHWSPGFREELRRHTAAVQRSAAVYRAEQDETRFAVPSICATPGCDRVTRSKAQLCQEHR